MKPLMNMFINWLAPKLIKNAHDVKNLKVRAGYGSLEAWTSIVVNLALFAIKIVIGLSVKSVALIADAVHTLADSVTSIIVIIGFKITQKPADQEHPFGHGRTESIAALIISILLFIAGFELLKEAIHNIAHPVTAMASPGMIAIVAATIVVKELMARFSYRLGEIINSQALKADALHHRTDVYATALVVVALIAAHFGFNRIDGIMGVLVSGVIFYSAYAIAKEAISPLLGEAPSEETLMQIARLANDFEGVLGVHDIIYHSYGQTVIVSLHIEVSDQASVNDLHELAEAVETKIGSYIGGTVIAHIDPVNVNHPGYQPILQKITQIVAADPRLNAFHDLRIIGANPKRYNAVFDIVPAAGVDQLERHELVRSMRESLQQTFPDVKAVIKADPSFAYTPN